MFFWCLSPLFVCYFSSYICSEQKRGNNKKNESILEKNKVSVKAGKMMQEKRQLPQSLAQN